MYQALFLCKQGRPDIMPGVVFLTTRVQHPTQQDWIKLVKMMNFLQQTQQDILTLEANNLEVANWHTDVAFAIHPDFCSHTGMNLLFGKGTITGVSRKQMINARSSTEAELVGADKTISPMIQTALFMESQGYPILENILYQDNTSAILLETTKRKVQEKNQASKYQVILYYQPI